MAKVYSLKAGTEIIAELLKIADKESIHTAGVQAIGALDGLKLAFYNQETKRYEERRFKEQMEAATITGNLTRREGKPFLHLHGSFARRDMSVVAGHIVWARANPLMEVVITRTTNRALRKFDDKSGLSKIYKF